LIIFGLRLFGNASAVGFQIAKTDVRQMRTRPIARTRGIVIAVALIMFIFALGLIGHYAP
jgi:hypothetical protein